jgi:hypothetical protein
VGNLNTIEGRRQRDLARVIAAQPPIEPVTVQLMRVTGFTGIDIPNWRYKYDVRRAQVGTPPNYVPNVTTNALVEPALSVSELTNTVGNYVSYGVLQATIPAGFVPQPIPVGTYVLCVPHRGTDGALVWLIVNTQAIDGVCT